MSSRCRRRARRGAARRPTSRVKAALATNGGEVQLVDVATGKIQRLIAKGSIDRLAFSAGRPVAGGWRVRPDDACLERGHRPRNLVGRQCRWPASATAAITFSPDGRLVAAGTYLGEVILRIAATAGRCAHGPGQVGPVRAVAISPDNRLLAASGDTGAVTLYELATGQLVKWLEGHAGNVWSLAFAPDGRSLVSGSFDGTALVLDLTGRELAKTRGDVLTATALEEHCTALDNLDARAAYQAVQALAGTPKKKGCCSCAGVSLVGPRRTRRRWRSG